MLRIGLDFDGVIVDHCEHKLRAAVSHGVRIEPWQANSNLMHRYMHPEDYVCVQNRVYCDLTEHAPPVRGALEHMARLEGELHIVSARRAGSISFAQEWMRRHGVYDIVPPEQVHFCDEGRQKAVYVERFGIEVFLDDSLSVLRALPDRVDRYLFDEHDSTRRVGKRHRFTVVSSWPDFLSELERRNG